MAHWRDHLNSTLLGAYSLWSDEADAFIEKQGKILHVAHEDHNMGKAGNQNCFVAYTTLHKTKPIKINVTIANAIEQASGQKNPEKWNGTDVIFYVDLNVKSKEGTKEALRVKKMPYVKPDYTVYENQLKACKTLAELKDVFTAQGFPQTALEKLKDELKTQLK